MKKLIITTLLLLNSSFVVGGGISTLRIDNLYLGMTVSELYSVMRSMNHTSWLIVDGGSLPKNIDTSEFKHKTVNGYKELIKGFDCQLTFGMIFRNRYPNADFSKVSYTKEKLYYKHFNVHRFHRNLDTGEGATFYSYKNKVVYIHYRKKYRNELNIKKFSELVFQKFGQAFGENIQEYTTDRGSFFYLDGYEAKEVIKFIKKQKHKKNNFSHVEKQFNSALINRHDKKIKIEDIIAKEISDNINYLISMFPNYGDFINNTPKYNVVNEIPFTTFAEIKFEQKIKNINEGLRTFVNYSFFDKEFINNEIKKQRQYCAFVADIMADEQYQKLTKEINKIAL